MHLDGARILNAMIYTGDDPADYCKPFDTVSICFSKGLGSPIGSVVVGSEKDIWYAKNIRKMLGGGMRQAGILAQAMLVSLEDWQIKLKEDNDNCLFLATELNNTIDGATCDLGRIHTNMFSINPYTLAVYALACFILLFS